MRGRVRKRIWSVAAGPVILGALWAMGGFENEWHPISPNQQPDLLVEKELMPRLGHFGRPTGDFDEYVRFTNVGRTSIVIWNVLINDKEHCAKLGAFEPPVTLFYMGGWSSLRFICPGHIAGVKVTTDHGNAIYLLN
jgi:hypothetical protein